MSVEDLISDFGKTGDEMNDFSTSLSDTIQWDQQFPHISGIVHIAHSIPFSRLFLSSLHSSIVVYASPSLCKTNDFSLSQSFQSHNGEITSVASDHQSTLYSISTDHHLIITNIDDLSVLSDIDCGYALDSLTLYQDILCTAGSHYSVDVFSLKDPSTVSMVDCLIC